MPASDPVVVPPDTPATPGLPAYRSRAVFVLKTMAVLHLGPLVLLGLLYAGVEVISPAAGVDVPRMIRLVGIPLAVLALAPVVALGASARAIARGRDWGRMVAVRIGITDIPLFPPFGVAAGLLILWALLADWPARTPKA